MVGGVTRRGAGGDQQPDQQQAQEQQGRAPDREQRSEGLADGRAQHAADAVMVAGEVEEPDRRAHDHERADGHTSGVVSVPASQEHGAHRGQRRGHQEAAPPEQLARRVAYGTPGGPGQVGVDPEGGEHAQHEQDDAPQVVGLTPEVGGDRPPEPRQRRRTAA